MGTNQHYITRLEKKGVKPTAVRILVFRALEEAQLPVSLLDLENLLETVDKSTIFFHVVPPRLSGRKIVMNSHWGMFMITNIA